MGKRIIKIIKYLLECILSVIYSAEYKCVECGSYLENQYICDECIKKIKLCKDTFNIGKSNNEILCYSASYYSNIMRNLILRLKYKSDFICADIIADFMIRVIQENAIEFDGITFVPMTKKAVNKRGYNQSRILAKIISDKVDVKLIDCLKKVKETKDQIGLDYNSRWENLSFSFKIRNSSEILNKNILIIDDVITTGATSYYCAEELINNGAKKVSILTAAKSSI